MNLFKLLLHRFLIFCRSHAFLLILILVLILLRTGMVIFDLWSLNEGGDLPEGLINGNFAFDILDNTWRGLEGYLYISRGHLGNELLTSIIAIPLYLLFGNSLFVLSLVPILYSIGILILIYYICNRWFRKSVAKVASVLFVCAPLILQSWSIYPYCLDLESSFFSLLAIALFFSLIESKTLKTRRTRFLCSAVLGIVSGIGIFHSEIFFLTLGFIFMFWFIKNRLFFIRPEFFIFFLFLLVGLIPYFYLGSDSLFIFIKSFIGGGFSNTYSGGRETHSLLTTLTLISVLFWPINNILFSKFNGLVVTLIGLPGIIGYIVATKRSVKKRKVIFYFLALYCFSYIFMALVIRVAVQYYFFPIFAHMTIIMAVCFYEVQNKYFKQKKYYRAFFYLALFYCCFVNVNGIVRNFDYKNIVPSLKKQLKINGCCFYWGWRVQYYFPIEAKTSTALEVKVATSSIYFKESSHGLDINSPLKTIFISKSRNAFFLLNSPESYLCYGIDVSFEGLEKLAIEIKSYVPKEHQEKAFKGLAVFYVNDNWLRDLIGSFKAGIIEKYIPKEHQHYFYEELKQKIANRYKSKPQKIEEIINSIN